MCCPDLSLTSRDACAFVPWDVAWGGCSADGRLAALTINADGRDKLRLLDTATSSIRSPAHSNPAQPSPYAGWQHHFCRAPSATPRARIGGHHHQALGAQLGLRGMA